MRPVVFAHGLESGPIGRKSQHLMDEGFAVVAPDCRKQPLIDRISALQAALDAHPDAVLVGSSYGGLASAWIATQRPLAGLLLLAPALHWNEPPIADVEALAIPASTPTAILHGLHDAVVPIAVSRRLAARSPHAALRELDDGHALGNSLQAIVGALRQLT